MRPFFLLAFLPVAFWAAAPALTIENPVVSQMEGGDPDAAGFEHIAGETLFFSCRVSGFTKAADDKIHLTYSVQAFDPKGVPLAEIYKNEISEEVLPQDKEWLPKIATEVQIPPLALPGEYKIVVKAEDALANTSTETPVPFRVRGRAVAPSDKLTIRNFGFYRDEDDAQPLPKPVYHNGSNLAAKFDITGYQYGPNNKIDVTYVVSILGAGDRVLWKQPEPAADQSESFYPKPYISASMSLGLETVKAGEYTMMVRVMDATGKQTSETKYPFTVE
ncbi:MAG: hypothetical protein ABSC23_00565 [Bryobacteraceae bacterium]|jgi:hypothetical protein